MGLRESLNQKPWISWAIALVAIGAAGYMYVRSAGGGKGSYGLDRMTEMVTIKYADTGDEEQIPRGRLEKMLRTQGDKLDPTKGLINPKSGQPTGFIFDKSDWEETIARINREKEAARQGDAKTGK